MTAEHIFEQILKNRGITPENREDFLNPNYETHLHDPFLLNDMEQAVARIVQAKEQNQTVYIYGDYDIDGLSATTLLLDAFASFGIHAEAYIPDRFEEGYGLNFEALKKIKERGADLVVTVDCGSVSVDVIDRANKKLKLDIIVTDHHTVGDELPDCVAVINPKRTDNTYPFIDLAGVGVAFKLVQAVQSRTDGLPIGQEKWLLDLVALGTVCDVVDLQDENRAFVHFGLQVMGHMRRPGIRELLRVSGVNPTDEITTTTLGFRVGPRLNASGRLIHARYSLDALRAKNVQEAQEYAEALNEMNIERRALQQRILEEARAQAESDSNPVLVLAGENWSHGVVGIVAAKIMEEFKKPSFVLEILPDKEEAKGSARSFGDFKAVDAVRRADFRLSGGGHAAAAGVTLKAADVDRFRNTVNTFHSELGLKDQHSFLKKDTDVELIDFNVLTPELVQKLDGLAPFGRANPVPMFLLSRVHIHNQRLVGAAKNHLQLELADKSGAILRGILFNQTVELNKERSHKAAIELQISTYRPGTVECIIHEISEL